MDIISLPIGTGLNRPGMGGFVLLAEIPKITAFGAYATDTNFGDALRITGDHTFGVDDGFVRWETDDDIAQFSVPITGTKGSLGFKPEVNLYLPGLDPARALSMIQNRTFIMLVPAFGCESTQYAQIGDACNPVRILPSDGFKSGTAGGNDPRGWTLKMGANYAFSFYEGEVTMATEA